MIRRRLLPLFATILLAPGAASGQCEVGSRPGATLLFPYFEVDLTRADGATTLLSVNVDSSVPVLTRVVVWSDWAIPVLSFDLLLKAHDVQTINLRDVLNGIVPSTGGPELLAFIGCTDEPPAYGDPGLDHERREEIRSLLTGGTNGSQCQGEMYGDGRARGYVTVDTVNRCSGLDIWQYGVDGPADAAFHDHLTDQNVLWGDLLYVDPSESSAQGVEAVALRAFTPRTGTPVNTFYGGFSGWSGRDRRSPLPTLWSTRFLAGGAFSGGTDLIVFRNHYAEFGATCGKHPYWWPLSAASIVARDEAGTRLFGFEHHGLFAIATQRIRAAQLAELGLRDQFGRLELDLSKGLGDSRGAWVIPVMTASGRYSVDFNGQPIDTGCGKAP